MHKTEQKVHRHAFKVRQLIVEFRRRAAKLGVSFNIDIDDTFKSMRILVSVLAHKTPFDVFESYNGKNPVVKIKPDYFLELRNFHGKSVALIKKLLDIWTSFGLEEAVEFEMFFKRAE